LYFFDLRRDELSSVIAVLKKSLPEDRRRDVRYVEKEQEVLSSVVPYTRTTSVLILQGVIELVCIVISLLLLEQ